MAESPAARVLFRSILAVGILLPPVIRVAAEVISGGKSLPTVIAALPSLLFAPGYNLFLLFALSAAPFVALAFFVRSRVRGLDQFFGKSRAARLGGVIGAIVFCFVLTIGVQVDVWRGIYSVAPGSSTAVIAFFFLPVYALAAIGLGYLAGWLVGRILPSSVVPREVEAWARVSALASGLCTSQQQYIYCGRRLRALVPGAWCPAPCAVARRRESAAACT